MIVTEIMRPKPINWKPSYTATAKVPFGCFILFNELENIFPNTEIKKVEESLFEALTNNTIATKKDDKGVKRNKASNLMLINNIINTDEQETNKLLDYVAQGNDVFIAATYFGYQLSDTLNLDVNSHYGIKEDSITVSLTNKALKNKKFYYKRAQNEAYFRSVDTLNTTVLGHVTHVINDDFTDLQQPEKLQKDVNFIKVKFGKGNFYLNTLPIAYTNYYMLKGQKDYVTNTFSYLKDRPLFWDNYKKSGKVFIDSPLRFVLSQDALKWAYYLTIVGLLIFVIFKAKREQRIIPVIEPLQNSSVAFAKTVGSLYHTHKDYPNLIAKKLNYFLEFIRSQYFIDTNTIDDSTAKNLAAKAGKSVTETKELLDMILYLKNKTQHTEQDLIQLNKKITAFKK